MSFSHAIDWYHECVTPAAAFRRHMRARLRAIEKQIYPFLWVIDVLLVVTSSLAAMILLMDATAVALDKLELLAENDFSKIVVARQDADLANLLWATLLPAILLLVSRRLQAAFERA